MTRINTNARRGAIVPMTALMLVVLLGMVAFAVDTSWMVMTQSELQNSADAAALAGSQQLVKNYPLYAAPGQTANNKAYLATAASNSARSTAKTYGGVNGAGGLATITYLDADIEVGFTAANGTFTAYSSGGNYPNTVKVRSRRDTSANSSLKLFFGPVLGKNNVPLSAPATATLYTGTVNSFRYPSAGNTAMLPFTYDVNHWKNFVDTGRDPDGGITRDGENNPIIQVYPSIKFTGNFGQLSLNDDNVGSSQMRTWVQDGMTSAEMGVLFERGLLPLSAHDPNAWDWQGSTGFESSLIQTVNDYIGNTYWMPLFKPLVGTESGYTPGVGTGSGYNFNIVAFVPVRIVRPQQKNRQVYLQSVDLIDSAANFDSASIVPAGTATSSYFSSVLAPRLSN